MEVIPAINCADAECAEKKLRRAERFSEWIHLDAADGSFTFNRTWADPDLWRTFVTPLSLEVHLMVETPEKIAGAWLRSGAKRLIVHLETFRKDTFKTIWDLTKSFGAELMVSSNPETPLSEVKLYLAAKKFQALCVHPGLAGQSNNNFLPLVIPKIRFLREKVSGATIEADGGVDLETGRLLKNAGVDTLATASYIFGSRNPEDAYHNLKTL